MERAAISDGIQGFFIIIPPYANPSLRLWPRLRFTSDLACAGELFAHARVGSSSLLSLVTSVAQGKASERLLRLGIDEPVPDVDSGALELCIVCHIKQ
jgi:hypothetical protein